MAFITRLTRLLRADLHALLDHLEEPDLVLAQAVREMEQALDDGRQRAAQLERDIGRLSAQESDLEQVLVRSDDALDDCLAAGEDRLARPIMRRRLEAERQLSTVGRRRVAVETELGALRQVLAERAARLADLRARAAIYDEERRPRQSDVTALDFGPETVIRDADVEVALLRAKRTREQKS